VRRMQLNWAWEKEKDREANSKQIREWTRRGNRTLCASWPDDIDGRTQRRVLILSKSVERKGSDGEGGSIE